MKRWYVSSIDYMAQYDETGRVLSVTHESSGARADIVFDGLYEGDKRVIGFDEYDFCEGQHNIGETHELRIFFRSEKALPKVTIHLTVSSKGVVMALYGINHYTVRMSGHITYCGQEAFAICTNDTASEAIRAAVGPAAGVYDNAVYDPMSDSAFSIDGCKDLRLRYDWTAKKYSFVMQTFSQGLTEKIRFSLKKNLLGEKYGIPFYPMKKRGRYDVPPSGWMTWYAVRFGACEKAVLQNTEFQKEHLKDFGADTVWVDWEWCHRRYESERSDGVNNLHPDPEKYPHGLGYIADRIREAGFVPALWIGFTNDVGYTDFEQEHPDVSLAHQETWSGKYYFDITHPDYLDGYLPKAVQQVKDWGFEAVKYDTLPNCITAHEKYHTNMYQPELTTYTAYRNMIQKTRELLGEDCYMLSCSGADSAILWSGGVFDGARVGPDLFTWERFVETIGRIRKYYPMHGIVIHCDPDNVILRQEFSTFVQAVSRISIVSLLGLPLTFGDDLPTLPADRLNLLKRALPVLKTHPQDFGEAVTDGRTQIFSLAVELSFERYTVAGIMNLTDHSVSRYISFRETLRLEDGEYLVYDYFRNEFLGRCIGSMMLDIDPFDTRILCFRKVSGHPQICSTSRHLSQGAAELKDMKWKNNRLHLKAELVRNDPYTVTVYVPDDYVFTDSAQGKGTVNGNILTVTFVPEENGIYDFDMIFQKK